MSEISVDVSVTLEEESVRDSLYEILSKYRYELSQESGFERELQLFTQLGVDASGVFNKETASGEIAEVKVADDGSIRFSLCGGTISGPGLIGGILGLIKELSPTEMISIAFNTQVGEY